MSKVVFVDIDTDKQSAEYDIELIPNIGDTFFMGRLYRVVERTCIAHEKPKVGIVTVAKKPATTEMAFIWQVLLKAVTEENYADVQ